MAYYEDIIVLKVGETKCILCNEYVVDNNEHIKTHLNEERHRKLYLKRLFLQNNIIVRSEKVYCNICKINIADIIDSMKHINSEKHQSILNTIKVQIEQDGAFLEIPEDVDDKDSAFCSICNLNVNFTLENIKDHLYSFAHKRARCIAVQPYNGIFSVEGTDSVLWCKICQMYFENYIEVIFKHVDEDKDHITRLNKILYLIDGQNITIEKYLIDPKEDKALCRKCNMEVSCNVINIQDHIKGKKHKVS